MKSPKQEQAAQDRIARDLGIISEEASHPRSGGDSFLAGISRAIEASGERSRTARERFNEELLSRGPPILWLPDQDGTEGHGVGWFVGDTGFIAYRRYSNGYDPNTRHVLEFNLIQALLPHMPEGAK